MGGGTQHQTAAPRAGVPFNWAYTYTAYSLDFAVAALRHLNVKSSSLVFDPFMGSGTTAVAAMIHGCNSFGVDISPFSALLARARISSRINLRKLASYVATKPHRASKIAVTSDVLNEHDYIYADAMLEKICRSRGLSRSELWNALLKDTVGDFDSEVIAILSLALSAKTSAKVVKGSNPIWYKRVLSLETLSDKDRLQQATIALSASIADDLMSVASPRRGLHRIQNSDFISLKKAPQFDVCLTSPPYLNRLDYVVAHLPELSIMQLLVPFSIDHLRASMIGTTKIVAKYNGKVPREWGPTCSDALASVQNHKSYASANYYYHTYYSYFDRLYASVAKLASLMATNGRGVIVLQDSFYKDILVPTPSICAEMMRSKSCSAEIVKTVSVRIHMGRMSPKQNAYAPQKTLAESLIYFER